MAKAAELKIFSSPMPFSNRQVKTTAPVGSTVAEIVATALPIDIDEVEGVGAIVTINGQVIFKRHWKRVRPKEGTIINVRVVPMKGGGKNPLVMLLSIAITIAAPMVGSAIAGTAGIGIGLGTSFSTFIPFSQVIGFAVGIVGKLLLSALAPPPKQAGPANNPLENPTQFIEGAQNSINPYGVVPINLGTNRMIPPQAARPFPETQDGFNFVRQLFNWGWGERLIVSDFKVGESDLSDFTDFEIEHRLNGDLHLGTIIYSDDVYTEGFSVVLKEVDGFTTRTTQVNVDEALVDVSFLNGLTKFAGNGLRQSYNVQLEMQFALSGVSPQVWSSNAVSFTAYSGDSVVFDDVETTNTKRNISGTNYYVGYRKDIVMVDAYDGRISILNGFQVSSQTNPAAPFLPAGKVQLASALILTKKPSDTVGAAVTTVESFTDDRQASLFTSNGWRGIYFNAAGNFAPSHIGITVTVSSGSIKADPLNFTSAQAEVLSRTAHVKFAANGTYDIRIRRVTEDKENLGLPQISQDRILDEVTLTAIKSVTYTSPVALQGQNGTAMRIKGTDQLNGSLSTFNAIVSTVCADYDLASDTWIDRITSNPASLYRLVLQCDANAKALADSKINLVELADWHTHCAAQGYSYNRIIDFEASVDDILRDIASAGAASPAIVDGKRTVVIDRVKDDIVQMITPRNSWGYSGDFSFPDLPHALRVQFRNADKGYIQDELIVYDDGYNIFNATKFESVQIESCTNSDLAFKHGRRYIASARLRRETHTFMMDIENLVALRGNRIVLEHDVPIVGIGDGRVKSVQSSGSPELITGVTLDDTITIPDDSTYFMRVRLHDGTWIYKQLVTDIGSFTSFDFVTPFAIPYSSGSPVERLFNAGDLVYVVETGMELDLIIIRIEPQEDFSARITAVNYAPEIFTAESTAIPAFVSNITTPLEFIRPLPPELVGAQSDESVMLLNSDGSLLKRAVFTLNNPNDGDIVTSVQLRQSGTDNFSTANVLEATPDRVILTGMDDATYYDIYIRYKRIGAPVMSAPLQLNNYYFVGASTTPSDPEDFTHLLSGDLSIFEWTNSTDVDHDHWIMKFSGVFSGGTYATAQLFKDNIFENNLTAPFQAGTYFLKAVDRDGNESDGAATIITFDLDSIGNVVAELVEAPAFGGTFDNTQVVDGALVLIDTSLTDGYYYFNNDLDLGAVYIAAISAAIIAGGTFVNNIFDITDVFLEDDIYGSGTNDIFSETDIFLMDDVFGIDDGSWSVELQYRVTNTDPNLSPSGFGAWTPFVTGNVEFRAIEFRLKLTSLATNVSPSVTSTLTVTVDMPDRIERGENLTCLGTGSPVTGATVTFSPAFKVSPAVAITLQNAATDDKIEFTAKTASGFSFKVYNQTMAGYVTRTYDYIASGYGRES